MGAAGELIAAGSIGTMTMGMLMQSRGCGPIGCLVLPFMVAPVVLILGCLAAALLAAVWLQHCARPDLIGTRRLTWLVGIATPLAVFLSGCADVLWMASQLGT